MAGVITYTIEETSPVAPARLFKALVLDKHNCFPKAMSQHIKSVESVQGSGDVGSIKQINFHEGYDVKYTKYRLDEIDAQSCKCKFTMIDSNLLGDKIECIKYELELVPSDMGSDCKMIVHFHTKGGRVISEEDIKHGK